ncbi:DsbB [Oceaniovalibus guishaninsula JLT2003]|uniref:DsbB n=1 Tax=Oceaniovalibus guishaninsula JLT2003 TaxID=1231392 RepID=K2HR44_9RHOB|nr:disulfide bond formation protein B [Oceaniovalibus guishaninsula]EKE45214.1 DsbB [Oceaniovalibus guishaninsula JLT2003]
MILATTNPPSSDAREAARRLMLLAATGSVALLAGAYTFQAMGYAPCAICYWQRWPHMLAALLGIVAIFRPARLVAAAGGLAAAATGGIGVYHTGVERGWWAGPSSCTGGGSLSGLSGADLLATDIAGRVVMCDQAAWTFAGLSMASWNAVFSFALAALWVLAARRAA